MSSQRSLQLISCDDYSLLCILCFRFFSCDNNIKTRAIFRPFIFRYNDKWTTDLELKLDSTKIKGFRINANNNKKHDELNISFYKNNVFVTGATKNFEKWKDNGWTYYEFEGEEFDVDKVKISFKRNSLLGFLFRPAKVYEFDFWNSSGCGEVGQTYFGYPFENMKEFLLYIFGKDVQKLWDYELADYVENIQGTIIYFLQPCASGGFISELSGDNRIILTASRGFEFADSWIGKTTIALNVSIEDSLFEEIDKYPKDDKISILEAYRYAADFVDTNPDRTQPQHPLIDDNGDKVGHHFYENGYGYSDPTKDGYLAANTFVR